MVPQSDSATQTECLSACRGRSRLVRHAALICSLRSSIGNVELYIDCVALFLFNVEMLYMILCILLQNYSTTYHNCFELFFNYRTLDTCFSLTTTVRQFKHATSAASSPSSKTSLEERTPRLLQRATLRLWRTSETASITSAVVKPPQKVLRSTQQSCWLNSNLGCIP